MELNRVKVALIIAFSEWKGETRKRDILPCDILDFDLTNLNDDFLEISKHHSRVRLTSYRKVQ